MDIKGFKEARIQFELRWHVAHSQQNPMGLHRVSKKRIHVIVWAIRVHRSKWYAKRVNVSFVFI